MFEFSALWKPCYKILKYNNNKIKIAWGYGMQLSAKENLSTKNKFIKYKLMWEWAQWFPWLHLSVCIQRSEHHIGPMSPQDSYCEWNYTLTGKGRLGGVLFSECWNSKPPWLWEGSREVSPLPEGKLRNSFLRKFKGPEVMPSDSKIWGPICTTPHGHHTLACTRAYTHTHVHTQVHISVLSLIFR